MGSVRWQLHNCYILSIITNDRPVPKGNLQKLDFFEPNRANRTGADKILTIRTQQTEQIARKPFSEFNFWEHLQASTASSYENFKIINRIHFNQNLHF